MEFTKNGKVPSDEMRMHSWQRKYGLRDGENEETNDALEEGRSEMNEETEYEPEIEMVGDKEEIDDVLDKAICMLEDPDNDYEFEEEVNSLPSSVQPEDKEGAEESFSIPVEESEARDDISTMVDKMRHERDDEEYRGYGMRRELRK